jgi:probable HAF family extracellular repeat protein
MNKPAVVSGCLALFACAPLLATQYSIIEIPQLTGGSGLNDKGDVVGGNLLYHHSSGAVTQFSDAVFLAGINDRGQIIGSARPLQASVWLVSGGQELLGNVSDSLSEGLAINNSGRAVGSVGDFHTQSHAVLWQLKDNSTTGLGTLVVGSPPGGFFDPGSQANAINVEGDVVGWSDAGSFDAEGIEIGVGTHAFRWHNGVMTDLGTLPGGSSFSVANGINDKGEVVGVSEVASGASHAFLHRRGRMIDLGDLANDPKLHSQADAINDRGEIVGWSEVRLTADNSIAQRAFVYSSGKMLSLTFQIETKSPLFGKVRLTEATAVNCKGWIVADGFDATTLQDHAYLLIPHDGRRNNCLPSRW